jgi:hypothetical protein
MYSEGVIEYFNKKYYREIGATIDIVGKPLLSRVAWT